MDFSRLLTFLDALLAFPAPNGSWWIAAVGSIHEWLPDWLRGNKELATWVTVLLGVVWSPFIQRRLAHRQQTASVVSANRVRWIEDFRKDVAVFCELAHHVAYCRVRMHEAKAADNEDDGALYRKEVMDKTVDLNTTYYHLILRLNTTVGRWPRWNWWARRTQVRRAEQKNTILNRLREVEKHLNGLTAYDDDIYADIVDKNEKLIELVREYLAGEWLRVERLE